MSENSNLTFSDTSGTQFWGIFTDTAAMMSITKTFLMITESEIREEKPYCERTVPYTAENMNLQKVSFFCLSHKTYYCTPVLLNLSLSDH